MSVREWIVKKLSLDLVIPEKTIEAIVSHQFDSAHSAVYKHNSVEISGFGKFIFNKTKALRVLEKMKRHRDFYEEKLKEDLPEKQRAYNEARLELAKKDIEFLNFKISKDNEK